MAPEQAAGDPTLVDARVDVYAVGAILRDLCGGGAAPAATSGGPSDVDIARPLRAIIAKAMTAEPANRYQDVTSLAKDVAAFRAGDPVSAYRENVLERVQRVLSRYRTPLLLVLAYLVMRTALLLFFGR